MNRIGVKDYIIEQWEDEDDDAGLLGFTEMIKKKPVAKVKASSFALHKVIEEAEKDNQVPSVSLDGSGDEDLDKYLAKKNRQ